MEHTDKRAVPAHLPAPFSSAEPQALPVWAPSCGEEEEVFPKCTSALAGIRGLNRPFPSLSALALQLLLELLFASQMLAPFRAGAAVWPQGQNRSCSLHNGTVSLRRQGEGTLPGTQVASRHSNEVCTYGEHTLDFCREE